MFKASDVKELREKTGAGMLDCKKALEACEGNMEKAIDWLREKGISKAAKKEGRIAAEGTTKMIVDGNKAIILEVNSETDFVAKNEKFTTFVDKLANAIMNSDVTDMDSALALTTDEGTVSDMIVSAVSQIGEKISFRRFEKVTKTDDEVFGIYSHMGGRITSLVVLNGNSNETAKDVAMHVAAMKPLYLTSNDVPEDVLNAEREVYKEQSINEGKSPEIAEKMVEGRIKKYYKEVCLNDQIFIKDSSLSVRDYASKNNCTIKSMIRYEVGEGMEKRNDNFAEEVMSQVNAAN